MAVSEQLLSELFPLLYDDATGTNAKPYGSATGDLESAAVAKGAAGGTRSVAL